MADTMHVLFVSERPRRRASVERTLPVHGPFDVTSVARAAAALDALSERDVDCVAVEHGVSGNVTGDADTGRITGDAETGRITGDADTGRVTSDADTGRVTSDADTGRVVEVDDENAIRPEEDGDDAGRDDDAGGSGGVPRSGTVDGEGTDALRVLRLVRDTDPAVPLVVLEAADASSVASDAISLDVTEYVREREVDDPLGALARACYDAATTYHAEQDVAMLNDLARNVYERVTDGFFALDRDWRFTYVNDATEEIMEVSADDVLGENIWEAFPGTVGTDFYTEYHRAMAAQEPVTFREHYPPLEKTFEVRAFPSEDGLSVHFRTVVDDDGAPQGDHLLELTNLLSSDLLESIDALRADLEDARAAADQADVGDGPVEEIDDALDAVDRMESLVNYSIRLANERPTPHEPRKE